ncbi:hypothetical protein PEPE_0770 [Pediococcus pentosaceus ATCC 25745]|uniref:DUF1642 domain-containing protein n=1 Tax=Pediococcus pentosaceus (strain ATCC 25745 / CCUG 21536 / LMG 10740 / 183-1w) TaxID=278197 RepID=Q03G41_PEDPA|nr:DUF1642 domain-containing protein [Pediococcus pentosaceus]ABJ67831.1 hypothetical protein PEPE_0770 [Pediococcus pentosaceus ATCC 25745]
MTKDEYVKKLKKYYDDNKLKQTDSYGKGYTYGLAEALVYAIGLAGKLDESQKAVIPQFVADWIEEAKEYYEDEVDPLRIIFWIGDYISSAEPHYEWLKNIDNQKLLFNAIANGYEVEKEPELHVKLKGLIIGSAYLNYNIPFKTFSTNSLSSPKHMNTEFTKSWLAKNWPEYEAYNNAGLLEFEEVEN